CDAGAAWTGGCGVTAEENTLDISGTKTDPGTSNPSDGQGNPDTKPFTPLEKCNITSTSIEFCPTSPAVNGVGEIPEITLTDLAQFAPAPATLSA
ncbi:MAG TPA: hypothetical protein VFF85_05185, partial [Microbacterium sp.]|nr:hypothetical protein [Microbacterium sp.]